MGHGWWSVYLSHKSLLSHGERRRERKEKNPLEKLITNKGGRGLPLSGDQPRTQRLFITLGPPS